MLSVNQTEAAKRETLGKPGRPRDDRSLGRGGGFHLSKFASNPTRVELSNRRKLTGVETARDDVTEAGLGQRNGHSGRALFCHLADLN
jgi:hypothetical protein